MSTTELAKLEAKAAERAAYDSTAEDDPEEPLADVEEGENLPEDAEGSGAHGEEGEDDLTVTLPPPSNDAGLPQAAA